MMRNCQWWAVDTVEMSDTFHNMEEQKWSKARWWMWFMTVRTDIEFSSPLAVTCLECRCLPTISFEAKPCLSAIENLLNGNAKKTAKEQRCLVRAVSCKSWRRLQPARRFNPKCPAFCHRRAWTWPRRPGMGKGMAFWYMYVSLLFFHKAPMYVTIAG